jgi:hypothetical protein
VDPTERFTDVVRRAESDIALDEACFLIAAHAHGDIDVDARCRELDVLSASLDVSDAGALARALFTDLGFAGNTVDYGDPDNSYLDAVLDRRLGIPITLSVLMIEVGRRPVWRFTASGCRDTSSSGRGQAFGTTRSMAGSRSTTQPAPTDSPRSTGQPLSVASTSRPSVRLRSSIACSPISSTR